MKATLIKELENDNPMVRQQVLLRCEPPLEGNKYVVASAADVMLSGPEVYLFAAKEDGEITNWLELFASQRGTLDIQAVLKNAGYELAQMSWGDDDMVWGE